MKPIIAKFIRHTLTALGGVGVATDSNVEQIAGAISIIVGIALSLWEAREKKPSDPAAASVANKIGLPLILAGAVFCSGCAAILPGNDPVIVRAQQTREIAFSTFDTFVTLEYRNREALQKINPNFTDVADNIRVGAPKWFKSFDAVLVAYKSGKTPATKSKLDGAIAVIESALTEAQTYIALAAEKGVTP